MKKTFNELFWALVGICSIFFLASCNSSTSGADLLNEPYARQEFMMGTYIVLNIYDEGKGEVLDEAIDLIAAYDQKLSSNDAGSEIDQINQNSGSEKTIVSPDTYELLEISAEYSKTNDTSFDYTIGPLVNLWQIGFEDARVPTEEEMQQTMSLVDPSLVTFDAEEQSIYLEKEGMALDLGGIAKGYIADQVKKLFEERGVTTALIDLGGNVLVMGNSPHRPEGGFNVGVQNPFDSRGAIAGYMNVLDKAVTTSGTYERYLEKDGKIYHHILDPKTGYPVDNGLTGVTIISEASTDGDALSTAVFALGLEEGLSFVNSQDNLEAIFITDDKKLYTTDGLIHEFKLTDENIEWVQ